MMHGNGKIKIVCLGFVLIWMVVITSSALAVGGRLTANTSLDARWQVDDNFFKKNGNDREVTTYRLAPGFSFGIETGKSVVTCEYELQAYYYDDEDAVPVTEKDASDDDYVGHLFNFSADSQITDRLKLFLEEAYMKTRDPANTDVYNNTVNRNKYGLNRLTPAIFFQISERTSFLAKYRNTDIRYSNDTGEDHLEHRGILDFYYSLSRFASVFMEAQAWHHEYDKNSIDYDSVQFSMNYSSKFKYFMVSAGAGYHDRAFDTDEIDDIDTFMWNLSVQGQNASGDLGIPRSRMMVMASQNFNDYGTGDQYFTATRVDAMAGHLFAEKVDVSIYGYYQVADYEYPADNREDDIWLLKAMADYHLFDFFVIGVEMGTESRDSNMDGYDYDNTWYLVHGKIDYDLGRR